MVDTDAGSTKGAMAAGGKLLLGRHTGRNNGK